MKRCTYFIVGGGMAAAAAVDGIRRVDRQGGILLVSAEPVPPYDRPPLSKSLWTGKKSTDDIWRKVESAGTEIILDRRITEIRPDAHEVTDDLGRRCAYEKLLVATGGRPRVLPFDGPDILYFRTYVDYRRLRDLAAEKERFLVIGGGFIGSELAAALAMQKREVTMVFPEAGIGALAFPADLARHLNGCYGDKGVRVRPNTKLIGIERYGEEYRVFFDRGESVTVDVVVAGIGLSPNTELAANAGLAVDNGITVGADLRTTAPDIYAAGDVANFYCRTLRQRMRAEHEDNANCMGEAAGRAMAGADVSYTHLPMFYSDLFELGYEAVGTIDARLQTVEYWLEPYVKGILFYLSEGFVKGAVFWNVWDQVDAGRELLARTEPTSREALEEWARHHSSGG